MKAMKKDGEIIAIESFKCEARIRVSRDSEGLKRRGNIFTFWRHTRTDTATRYSVFTSIAPH
jgi:hypothetical protein